MQLSARHIRHFKAVAEELHFGRAAEQLNIAQPALSRSIKQLEDQLEVQLLHRDNRNVSLTKSGAVFLEGCRNLVSLSEDIVRLTQKTAAGTAGDLKIGYTDFAISGLMPEILVNIRKQHPDISLEPVHGFTRSQLIDLEQDKLDIGFITGPLERPGYQTVVVQEDAYLAVFYENHPLAQKDSIKLEELSNENFILGTQIGWEHYHRHLLKLCHSAGFKPKIVQTAFNVEGISGLVACEMGISIQPACIKNNLRKGLVAREIEGVTDKIPTLAIWKISENSPVRQAFGDFLLGQVQ